MPLSWRINKEDEWFLIDEKGTTHAKAWRINGKWAWSVAGRVEGYEFHASSQCGTEASLGAATSAAEKARAKQ